MIRGSLMSSRDGPQCTLDTGRDASRCTEAGRGHVEGFASSDARSTSDNARLGALRLAVGRLTSSLETSCAARSTSEKARLGAPPPTDGRQASSKSPAATPTGVEALLGAPRHLEADLSSRIRRGPPFRRALM
jgi:hypothetical protein